MFKYLLILSLVFLSAYTLEGVTQLTDNNFNQLVHSQPNFWIVLFAADWCGHCQHLKPQFQKLAPMMAQYGVKLGIVGDKNSRLVNDFVVDHKTHMVSYPKLKIFLGEELMGDVPPGMRTANQIKFWFVKEYNLGQQQEL